MSSSLPGLADERQALLVLVGARAPRRRTSGRRRRCPRRRRPCVRVCGQLRAARAAARLAAKTALSASRRSSCDVTAAMLDRDRGRRPRRDSPHRSRAYHRRHSTASRPASRQGAGPTYDMTRIPVTARSSARPPGHARSPPRCATPGSPSTARSAAARDGRGRRRRAALRARRRDRRRGRAPSRAGPLVGHCSGATTLDAARAARGLLAAPADDRHRRPAPSFAGAGCRRRRLHRPRALADRPRARRRASACAPSRSPTTTAPPTTPPPRSPRTSSSRSRPPPSALAATAGVDRDAARPARPRDGRELGRARRRARAHRPDRPRRRGDRRPPARGGRRARARAARRSSTRWPRPPASSRACRA